MKEHYIGSVVVVDNGLISGIFTERDIFMKIAATDIDLKSTPVKDYMTKNPICLSPEHNLKDVVDKMIKGRFRHVPITDNSGVPIGIVSIKDVMDFIIPSDE